MNNSAKHSRLCTQIVGVIRKRGGYAKRIDPTGFGDSGVADVLACFAGRFLALEVKTGKAVLTKLQQVNHKQVIGAGGVSEVVRSVEDAETILDAIR